jgi:diguanylate cyclase with GGDEF domain
MELLDRQTVAYVLDRMIAVSARYGRSLCLVRLRMPASQVPAAAGRLRCAVRDADVLARWTDEDLLALLPETDLVGAEVAAERLRDTLREFPVLAGAVQWHGETGEVLVRRANAVTARN